MDRTCRTEARHTARPAGRNQTRDIGSTAIIPTVGIILLVSEKDPKPITLQIGNVYKLFPKGYSSGKFNNKN